MNPHLEKRLITLSCSPPVSCRRLVLVVLITGLSATMFGQLRCEVAVAIMMRDVIPSLPARCRRRTGDNPLPLDAGVRDCPGDDFRPDLERYHHYIHKMISMLMSGLFVCSILGRFWLRFNWQGAWRLLSGMLVSNVVLIKADWLAYWGQPGCIPSVVGSFVSAVFVTLMTPASKISRQQALEMITQGGKGRRPGENDGGAGLRRRAMRGLYCRRLGVHPVAWLADSQRSVHRNRSSCRWASPA